MIDFTIPHVGVKLSVNQKKLVAKSSGVIFPGVKKAYFKE